MRSSAIPALHVKQLKDYVRKLPKDTAVSNANLTRLEAIANALDRDDLSLEKALALFEEGIARLKDASAELAKAEGRVSQLVEKSEGIFEVTDDRS